VLNVAAYSQLLGSLTVHTRASSALALGSRLLEVVTRGISGSLQQAGAGALNRQWLGEAKRKRALKSVNAKQATGLSKAAEQSGTLLLILS